MPLKTEYVLSLSGVLFYFCLGVGILTVPPPGFFPDFLTGLYSRKVTKKFSLVFCRFEVTLRKHCVTKHCSCHCSCFLPCECYGWGVSWNKSSTPNFKKGAFGIFRAFVETVSDLQLSQKAFEEACNTLFICVYSDWVSRPVRKAG